MFLPPNPEEYRAWQLANRDKVAELAATLIAAGLRKGIASPVLNDTDQRDLIAVEDNLRIVHGCAVLRVD